MCMLSHFSCVQLFGILLWPLHSMWDLCSLTRDRTIPLPLEVQNLSHWTAREIPLFFLDQLLLAGVPRYRSELESITDIKTNFD